MLVRGFFDEMGRPSHIFAVNFAARVACVIQGSTETTFYVLAVYFGSVAIKKTRHAVPCALLAELAGVIAAICVAYVFWG